MVGAESPGAAADLRRPMTGVARRTSPSAGFFGSSARDVFRGLEVALVAGGGVKFVFRGAGATGALFIAAEGTAAGGRTGAGAELAAEVEISGREAVFAKEG